MIYEFQKTYDFDSNDTSITGSGSGVHLYKDVTFTFDFEDRMGNAATTFSEISQNPSIGDMTIGLLNNAGNSVYQNYYSGNALRSFTFTEQNNIDVFGSYQENFGILVGIKDNSAGYFYSKFQTYSNVPEFEKIIVTDGSGKRQNDAPPAPDYFLSGNNITGEILINTVFLNSPYYTRYNKVDIYYSTGSGVVAGSDLFLKSIPIFTQSTDVSFSIGSSELNYNTPYYFLIVPYGEVGSGVSWEIGPKTIIPPAQASSSPQVNGIFIIEGTENAFIDLVTGVIPTTGAHIIDTIPTGTYYNIDYIIKIEGASSEVYGTRLSLIVTGENETGCSFGEFAESTNSRISYSVSGDSGNTYLLAQLADAPAPYKLYKTSV